MSKQDISNESIVQSGESLATSETITTVPIPTPEVTKELYLCRLCKEEKDDDALSPAQLFPKRGKPNMSCRECRAVYSRRWRKSEKGYRARGKYGRSEKGRATIRRYRSSKEGRELLRINRLKRKHFGKDATPRLPEEKLQEWMVTESEYGILIKPGISLPPKLAALREILNHDENVRNRRKALDAKKRAELKEGIHNDDK